MNSKNKTETEHKTDDILAAKNKRLCLICEKEIQLIEKDMNMLDGGGFIEASFGYGSKHDQIGLRQPKHSPTDHSLKDHPGYSPVNVSWIFEEALGKTFYAPNGKYPVESVVAPWVENCDLKTKILASYRICSYICDECFEKKIHLFYGEEEKC